MLDWIRFKAANREITRIKRDKIQMEREAMWKMKEQSLWDVIKARGMEVKAYQKALGTFVDLEEDNLVNRKEVPTSGDYHEILMGFVDQYAPSIAKGAIKSVIKKRAAEINAAAEKFINSRLEQVMAEKEKTGEIKYVNRQTLEANK